MNRFNSCRELRPDQFDQVASALDDTPETVISLHLLRRRLCRAYIAGSPERWHALLLHPLTDSTEPMTFGDDPQTLWALLQLAQGWRCVEVVPAAARPLSDMIAARLGAGVRYCEDVYHALYQPVLACPNAAVRRLAPDDAGLIGRADEELTRSDVGSLESLLTEGVIAGAIADGVLVSVARTTGWSERHADIGVETLPAWRGRGFATAAAALVAQGVQQMGKMPVWSAGEGNAASLRIAQKLGFVEVLRRTYVIVEPAKSGICG